MLTTQEKEEALPGETVVPSLTALELATLASRIAPGICLQRSTEAIEAAMALIEAARETIDLKRCERELEEATEQADKKLEGQADDPDSSPFHFGYERGVKLITLQKGWDRALERFKDFLKSQVKEEGKVEELLTTYRQKGFTGAKISSLRNDLVVWWEKEKSRKASASRAAQKK